MADVFISYSKDYRHLTEELAHWLEVQDISVWWDTSLVPGDQFSDVIAQELDHARAVIVIWTTSAIHSPWVKSEANRAAIANKLISVKADDVPHSAIPMPFDQYHTDTLYDRDRLYKALVGKGVIADLNTEPRLLQGQPKPKLKRKAPPTWPSWAETHGEDSYGYWASFSVDRFSGEAIQQKVRWIPPGKFLMGSPLYEKNREDAEGPQVGIVFRTGFWLFETAVSQGLYYAVMMKNPSRFKHANHPVNMVSWPDAQAFMERLNAEIPGLSLALPSEAQWEYACRAGSSTPFEPTVAKTFQGKSLTPEEANYRSTHPYGVGPEGSFRGKIVPIQEPSFTPNAWGLWHMHGNVWEWCADAWQAGHNKADPTGQPRQSDAPEAFRVARGGGWGSFGMHLRSGFRLKLAPDHRLYDVGFRCMQEA